MRSVTHTLTLPSKKKQLLVPLCLDLPEVSLSKDDDKTRVGIILTHGAGGDMSSPHIRAYATGLAKLGLPCLTFTHRAPSLSKRVEVYEAVLKFASSWQETSHIHSWALAGHSMGARAAVDVAFKLSSEQATSVTKHGLDRAKPDVEGTALPEVLGCILFSYPLHPQGKPDVLRDSPLCSLQLPMLFIRGTSDAFSSEGPFQDVLKRMASESVQVCFVDAGSARACPFRFMFWNRGTLLRYFYSWETPPQVHAVEGAGHGLNMPKKAASDKQQRAAVEAALEAAALFCRKQCGEGGTPPEAAP